MIFVTVQYKLHCSYCRNDGMYWYYQVTYTGHAEQDRCEACEDMPHISNIPQISDRCPTEPQ